MGLEVRKWLEDGKMRDEEDMIGIVRIVGGISVLKDDKVVFSGDGLFVEVEIDVLKPKRFDIFGS